MTSDPLTIALLIAILAVEVGGFVALWLRPSDGCPPAGAARITDQRKDVH